MGEFVRVAGIDDVKPGHGLVAEVNGKALAVFNVDGQFHVIDNTCLHRGGPLGEGELEASVVTCPWHGWQFNVKTGRHCLAPRIQTGRIAVAVEGDDVIVEVDTLQ